MTTSSIPVKRSSGGKQTPEDNHPLQNLRSEIDHVFERFAQGWPQWGGLWHRKTGATPMEDWPAVFDYRSSPDVNIGESDGEYEITAELPGLDEKDIELTISDGVLTLKGEKKAEREDKHKDYHLTERRFGAFRRSFTLPAGVDEKKVAARFAKGVLCVTLPKTAEARQGQKKIEIKAS